MKTRDRAALRTVWLAAAGLLAAAVPRPAAGEEPKPPPVDQKRIDEAIDTGARWLMAELKKGLPPISHKGGNHDGSTLNEIVLYTLLHAGIKRDDPEMVKLCQEVCDKPPVHTYTGAIRAQALEMYDGKGLKPFIQQSAQFLIDNQSQEGYWGYSKTVELPPPPKITVSAPAVDPKDRNAAPGGRGTISVERKTTAIIPRRAFGQPNDNSNTQYAMLGLAACMAAGLHPPPDLLTLAEKWLTDQQGDDGGWTYKERGNSYGSMTAGGISSLAIIVRSAGKDPAKDVRIQKAIKWMNANMDFGTNPKKGAWHYYWIYAVERAGSMVGTEWFGDRAWYKEGSEWLLSNQQKDGSWGKEKDKSDVICDTCWAILFLKRATKHIAITYSGSHDKKGSN